MLNFRRRKIEQISADSAILSRCNPPRDNYTKIASTRDMRISSLTSNQPTQLTSRST